MEKKIGIITMHKVLNYGSALQAYALQKVLENMGNKVEIIDYIYPNKYHIKCHNAHRKIWRRCASKIFSCFRRDLYKARRATLNSFYKEHLHLSKTYHSRDELINNPPIYDIYMTGSDQVWNPQSIHEDTSFMLSFIDSPNKVAYAASFAKGEISEEYKKLYAAELHKYKRIFMREQKGCDIVKNLTGKQAEVVLDPTLLLNSEQWMEFAKHSEMHIKEPYILVYVLGYSFNVYPYMYELIDYVQKITGLKLVILNMSDKYVKKLSNKMLVKDASIYDFVKLFSRASMVITDSFHGTAFSLNMNVPFYSVINHTDGADTRIVDLLTLTGENARIIRKDSNYKIMNFEMKSPDKNILELLRESSKNKLSELLKKDV